MGHHQVRGTSPTFEKPRRQDLRSPLDKANGHEVIWPNVSPLFVAAQRLINVSFVYFIGEEDEGAIKIGLAQDPIKRLRSMQTGNPRRLRVECDRPGPVDSRVHGNTCLTCGREARPLAQAA